MAPCGANTDYKPFELDRKIIWKALKCGGGENAQYRMDKYGNKWHRGNV